MFLEFSAFLRPRQYLQVNIFRPFLDLTYCMANKRGSKRATWRLYGTYQIFNKSWPLRGHVKPHRLRFFNIISFQIIAWRLKRHGEINKSLPCSFDNQIIVVIDNQVFIAIGVQNLSIFDPRDSRRRKSFWRNTMKLNIFADRKIRFCRKRFRLKFFVKKSEFDIRRSRLRYNFFSVFVVPGDAVAVEFFFSKNRHNIRFFNFDRRG